MSNEIAIEVHDLTVSYRHKPALWNVDFVMPKGVIAGVVGPNGAGKSTLLKSMMGLLPIGSGYIKIFNQDLKEVRSKISYVPQRGSVDWDFPASVMDVVLMGRFQPGRLFNRTSSKDKQIARESLEMVQMLPYANRQISRLSGGQQQRVFIARALAQQAELYLMDEPFAGVDAATEESILKILQQMKAWGKTIVVVHHDLQTVSNYFDWVAMVNTSLIACGNVQDVLNEENITKAYSGKLNILSRVGDIMEKQKIPVRKG